ncbi:MAG TPA: M67 family metallopeptidase [Vicinamibacteria bacterium]|nr:M67 family metallopeptidase [Vicinamibacteria bacterium]
MSDLVRFSTSALDEIRREAARAYPLEGCGALLGHQDGHVLEASVLPNAEGERPGTRFVVSPADYLSVEEAAEARGLRLLGFWHSHPDHPARPSATDRQFAWPGLLTVVVAVAAGRPQEITAWQVRDGDPFEPVAIAMGS